ncbi:hypothetical protein JNM05_12020 [bacterium]|nr:hypothetical protein [bacterium]
MTELEYSKSVTNERFLIANKYLSLADSAVTNLTVEQKKQLLDALKQNSDFISELNSFHLNETVKFLINNPWVYFGEPYGKLIGVKFFGYWMNLAVNYQERPHPNISTLYLITNSNNFFVKSAGVLSLLLSLFLFFVYLKHASKAKLLFLLWIPYFMFFNVFVFRAEPRYVLPVLAFNIIILAEALRLFIDSRIKTSKDNEHRVSFVPSDS